MNSCPAQTELNSYSVHKYHKDTYLNISQAAELLRVSPSTLRRFETMGKITSVRLNNGYRSFRLSDIDNLRQTLQEEKEQEKQREQSKRVSGTGLKYAYVSSLTNLTSNDSPDNQSYKANLLDQSTYTSYNYNLPSRNFEKINKTFKKILAPEFLMLCTALVISGFVFNAANLRNPSKNKTGEVKSTYYNDSGKINPATATSKGSLLGRVLGIRDNTTDFVFNIDVPTNITKTLTVAEIAGVTNIDATTEDTLEKLVDINGDVVGTGLTDVKLADKIEYTGDWDFTGTWAIDGSEVTATADQLNSLADVSDDILDLADVSTELLDLSDVSDALVDLADSQVASGGIAFGDGSKYMQDTDNLYWNDSTNRLGIGTNTTTHMLTVNGDASFVGDVIGPTTGIFGYWVRTGTILSPTTPSDEVHLDGTLNLDGNLEIADTNINLNGSATTFTQSNGGDLIFSTAGGNFEVELASSTGDFIVNTGTNDLRVDTDQHRVGIGTASPSHKLQVVGDIGLSDKILFGSTTGGVNGDASYGIRAETGIMQYKNNGGSWLSIGSGGTGSASLPIGSVQYNDDGTAFGGSSYFLWNKTSHYLLLPEIRSLDNSTGLSISDYNGNLGLYVKPSGIGTTALVGVATSNPTHQFDVFGDIYASAKIATATDFYVGAVGLGTTAGGTIVGIDSANIDNSASANLQGTLEDLDAAITSAANGGITEIGSVNSGPAFINVATGYNQWLGMGAARGQIGFTTSPSGDVVHVSNASLGVGTTNPGSNAISAVGDINTTGSYLINGSSINTPGILSNVAYLNQANVFGAYNQTFDTSTLYINASTDRVGIGTTDPTSKLEVNGEIRGQRFAFSDNTNTYVDTFGTNNLTLSTSDSPRLTVTSGGLVGVGTTNPGVELDVLGNIRASTNITALGDIYIGTIKLSGSGTSNITSGAYKIGAYDEFTYSNATNVQAVLKDLDAQIVSVAGGSLSGTGPENYVTKYLAGGATLGASSIYDNGTFIGIGTTASGYKLNVDGDIRTSGDLYVGSIGIGASGANNTTSGAYKVGAYDEFTYSTSTNVQGVLKDLDAQMASVIGGSISGTGPANYLTMYTGSGSTLGASAIYDDSGNIGIGTTTPGTSKLAVAGDIYTTTDISINGIKLSSTGPDNTSSGAYKIGTYDEFLYSSATNVQAVLKDLDTQIATLTGVSSPEGTLSGTGPVGYITKYTGDSTLGASVIYETGNSIGIGTTTPLSKLDVSGGAAIGAYAGASSAPSNGLIVSGNMGVGTSTPSSKLEVVGETKAQKFTFQDYATTYIDTFGSNNMVFATNGTDKFTILSGGNVGVGTTNPLNLFSAGASSQFQVSSAGAIAAATGIVSSGNIDFSSLSAGGLVKADVATGRLGIASAGTDYQTPLSFSNGLTNAAGTVKFGGALTAATSLDLSSNNLEFSASGNGDFLVDGTSLYVDTGNNRVGIGTSSPATELEVVGEVRSTRFALQDSTGAYLDTIATNKLSLATDDAYRLTIDASGLVGIGTTVPGAKLEVETATNDNVVGILIDQNDTINNNVALEIQNAGTGNAIYVDGGEFIVDSTGNITATGTTGITLGINADVIFGSIGIRDVGATSTQSGAYLIGLNTAGFTQTTANNMQDAMKDLDAAITSASAGVITSVGSINGGAAFSSLASANEQWLGLGASRGRIGFSTSPTDTIYLLDANVGIGLTTPTAVLDINGTAPTNGSILKATGNVTGNNSKGIYFNPTLNASADNDVLNAMYIDPTYNAGAYTNLKDYALTIVGSDASMGLVRIGTGASNPTHKLYVEGGIGLTEDQYINYGYTNGVDGYGFRDNSGTLQFKNSAGSWTDMGGNWDLVGTTVSPKNGYKVGIGTTSTSINLAIGVTAANQEMIRLQDSTDRAGIFLVDANPDSSITGSAGSLALDYTNGAVYVNTNDGTSWSQLSSGGLSGTGPANYLTKYAGGTNLEASTLYEIGGNLGIGTTVPGALVDISKTFATADELLAGNATMTHSTGTVSGFDLNMDYSGTSGTAGFKGIDLMLTGDSSVGSGDMYGMYMNTDSYFEGSLLYLAHNSNRVFEVNGTQSTFDVPVNMASSGDLAVANNINLVNTTAGFITSDSPLYIQAGNAGENESLYLSSAGLGDVYVDDDLYVNQDLALNTGYRLTFDNDASADTYFTHDSANSRLGLWVDNQETARFIGVSSTSSTSLEIYGTLTQSQAFDVAEMYPTFDDSIEPGMIVSLETSEYGPAYALTKARGSQDGNIFGIVSTKPGVIMGGGSFRDEFCESVRVKGADTVINEEIQKITNPEKNTLENTLQNNVNESSESTSSFDNSLAEQTGKIKEEEVDTIKDRVNACLATHELPVALNGRVPVKISENSQKIKVGDGLTVSNISMGYAQKATSRDDIIIGKALEGWEPGSNNDSIMVVTGIVWSNNKYAWESALSTQSNLDAEDTVNSLADNLKRFGDAIGLRNNGVNDIADISIDVNILGKTTLADVTVTREFKAGLVEINSLDNSINVIGPECGSNNTVCESQTLYLQKSLSGNIDMFNNKIVFMPNGDVKISGTIEAEKVLASQYSVKSAAKSIGSSSITTGNKEVTIETTMVKDNSKIFITPTNNTNGQTLYIKSKSADNSFVVAIDDTVDNDITFDWFVVNVD